jgi:sporulation protein YlmC with PRC-barrel domain
MATEFILGARVSCPDGECGEVTGTIVDPAARTVTHLVIEPGHHHEDGRLVPVALVEAAAAEVRLRCTLAEFGALDAAEEVQFAEGLDYSGGYGPDSVQGYGNVGSFGVGGSVSGVGIGGSLGHHKATVTSENVPEGESEVSRNERVHATDGEIGRVKSFIVDPADHRLTHVVLREGHLWGHKDIAVPISAVRDLDDGIWLNITKKQVEALPPITRSE